MIDINHLKGKKIIGARISRDKEYFMLEFEDNTLQEFHTYGDCCSSSWIEHFTAPNDLSEGAIYYGFKELDLKEGRWVNENEDGEYIQEYEIRFSTSKGDIVVEFRNSSNGYYGGSMETSDTSVCKNEMIEELAGLTNKGDLNE